MTITLPSAFEALLTRKMSTGLYNDASEVVREALRQMSERDSALEWLRKEVGQGFDELDHGESIELDREDFMNHFRSRRQAA